MTMNGGENSNDSWFFQGESYTMTLIIPQLIDSVVLFVMEIFLLSLITL